MSAPTGPLASAGSLPRSLADALAAELVLASGMLADLAYELGSDGDTLRRHMASLQRIDHITQIQLAVAELLRNVDGDGTGVEAVTLQDMADRLRASLTDSAAAAA